MALDGVVPNIEEWERELDGPILNDPFIGIHAPPSPERPRSVAFVGPKGDVNGEYAAATTPTPTPAFFGNDVNGNIGTPHQNFYAPASADASNFAWMEATLDLTTMASAIYPQHSAAVTTASSFVSGYAPPTSMEDNEAFFAALGSGQLTLPPGEIFGNVPSDPPSNDPPRQSPSATLKFQQLNLQDTAHSSSDHTYAATEPARNSSSSPEMALSSGRHSVISATESWSPYEEEWASSDSSMSQDEIYDEIQRECAEIERKSASVSPASSKAGSPQPSTSTSTTKPSRPTRTTPYQKRAPSRNIAYGSRSSSRSLDDRKRELNRLAATKYREKKRLERENRSNELTDLETRNADLKGEVSSLEAEINYLKNLIKDIEARRRH